VRKDTQTYYYNGQFEGARSRGRPKKKWIDNIQEDCSDMRQWEPVKTVRVKTVLGRNGPGKKGPSDYLDSI